MAAKHIGLGRGLSALIKEALPAEPAAAPAAAAAETAAPRTGVRVVPIEKIRKSPWQPRRLFAPEALEDLTHSVRERGVLQPLLVRQVGDTYELIAGERRFRASQNAELREVPVLVLEATDKDVLELSLVENLQRADLNLIEEAEGYRALAEKFNMTQEEIALRMGKARTSVANALRLLNLADPVKQLVAENRLAAGHAKVLLGVEEPAEQQRLAHRVLTEDLSVRTLEHIVQRLKSVPKKPRAERTDIPDSHLSYLSDRLHQHLGTSVRVVPSKTLANGKKIRGTIAIDFFSNEDLDRLLLLLGLSDPL